MVRSALLLAAGLGTRLRPLTDVLPKCLAPIHGRPLLEYWLQALDAAGIERIVVNTHYHAGLVQGYVASSPWRGKVTLAHEDELLGTGGTVIAHADLFRDGPVLVAHADNLSLFDAREFCAAHETRPSIAKLTMMTFTTDDPPSCGIVTTDAQGMVNGFFEKVLNPPGTRANAAVYVFEPAVLDFALALRRTSLDISTEVLPQFLGRIWTWHNARYHRDIGTLQAWRAAQRDYPGPTLTPHAPDAWRALLEQQAPDALPTIEQLLAAQWACGRGSGRS
jgi:mannose-1-phosphate guanylyltransferase